MTTRETVIFLICGVGTLAMSLGAFGLLAAAMTSGSTDMDPPYQ